MRFRSLLLLLPLTTALGCDGGEAVLSVDLRTDLVAGAEVDEAIVTLDGATIATHTLEATRDYVAGVRVAEASSALGSRRLSVELRRGGELVAERRIRVELRAPRIATVVITRDCRGVRCGEGTVCENMRCVDEACSPENPDACEPACASAAECAEPASVCAAAVCSAGACLSRPTDLCSADEYCEPESGCRPRESTPADAGPPDAGPVDAGPPDAGPPDAGPGVVRPSDTFDGDGLDPQWMSLDTTANAVVVSGGELVISSSSGSWWFDNSVGDLLYVPVPAGDFMVTARVRVRSLARPSEPVTQGTNQLAVLMVRDPAGTASGVENWVATFVGTLDGPAHLIEAKSTTDDLTDFQPFTFGASPVTWPAADAELRICRVGTVYRQLFRGLGVNPWVEDARDYDRPDMPAEVQVGVAFQDGSGGAGPDAAAARFESVLFDVPSSLADCAR